MKGKNGKITLTYLGLAGMFCALVLALACGGGGGRGGSSNTNNYQYLYDHNASLLEGYTIRWPNNIINVYAPEFPEAQAAFNRWANSNLNFSFGSPGNIEIYWSRSLSSSICGVTYYSYYNSGIMARALIYINSNIIQTSCYGGTFQIMTHEAAHALGFLVGHDPSGTSIMSPTANGNITSQNRTFFQLLYSSPPGTDINGKLGKKRFGKSAIYDKNGSRLISGAIHQRIASTTCAK